MCRSCGGFYIHFTTLSFLKMNQLHPKLFNLPKKNSRTVTQKKPLQGVHKLPNWQIKDDGQKKFNQPLVFDRVKKALENPKTKRGRPVDNRPSTNLLHNKLHFSCK